MSQSVPKMLAKLPSSIDSQSLYRKHNIRGKSVVNLMISTSRCPQTTITNCSTYSLKQSVYQTLSEAQNIEAILLTVTGSERFLKEEISITCDESL